MLERNASYLAADAGTGKTIMAALAINAEPGRPAVYFCPPFLALNTKYELEKWNTWNARVAIFGADDRLAHRTTECDILIIPDSMVGRKGSSTQDITKDLYRLLLDKSEARAKLFVDEAHRYKNYSAKRTKAFLWLATFFDQFALMSGTPMPNGRPMELYPILSKLVPEVISHKGHHTFGLKYCGAFQKEIYPGRFVWDYTGASNVDDLFGKMREKFMLRIKKMDVLKELKPRTTEMVIIAEDLPPKIGKLDKKILRDHSPDNATLPEGEHVMRYLRLLGHEKARLAVPYIKDLLDETDECALVFARHVDVIEYLTKGLAKYKPLVITGSVPKGKRQELVTRFQTKKENRIFILNQEAGGLGLTLTKANLVFQVEPNWVPGINDQATDRADRIGQTRLVHERYLVFKNSMDRAIIEGNINKRNVSERL